MKKTLKIVFNVCSILIIFFCVVFFLYNLVFSKKNKNELLSVADEIVNENIITNNIENNSINENETFSARNLEKDKNIVGKIIIDKINVNAPIMDGVGEDILKKAVGHFSGTSYWNGNVCLASHNRGSYAHYFEKINKLSVGDEIKYKTKLGTRVYVVNEINNIHENNLSVLNNTEKNTITLITCVKSNAEERLCVKGIEKIL